MCLAIQMEALSIGLFNIAVLDSSCTFSSEFTMFWSQVFTTGTERERVTMAREATSFLDDICKKLKDSFVLLPAVHFFLHLLFQFRVQII